MNSIEADMALRNERMREKNERERKRRIAETPTPWSLARAAMHEHEAQELDEFNRRLHSDPPVIHTGPKPDKDYAAKKPLSEIDDPHEFQARKRELAAGRLELYGQDGLDEDEKRTLGLD